MFKKLIPLLIITFAFPALAANLDSDGDGLSDELEISKYYLDPYSADTDGDGYEDNVELRNGYSPHYSGGKRLHSLRRGRRFVAL